MKINLAKLLTVLGRAVIAAPAVIVALKPVADGVKGKPRRDVP